MGQSGSDLRERESHFEFGKNWAEYSSLIDSDKLELAVESIRQLVPDIAGKTVLDIGSGSGLFSVAALKLGAARVHAVDIDENSVATTRRVLETFAEKGTWTAEQRSVFELSPKDLGQFDVVYSWGVLHHTGDMWRAIDRAAAMVAPGGTFAFALYEKTPLCGAWRIEKRAYTKAPEGVQRLARSAYKILFQTARVASGRGIKRGNLVRGMDVDLDIHDWLGGYPYESANGAEVREHLARLSFEPVFERPVKVHLAGMFGTGCSEYVYKRQASA